MISKSESRANLELLVKKAEKSELASIGDVVYKIMDITKNPDSTATDLKNVIEVDPPLSAKILRRANSAQYGVCRNITSIQEAIVFMGFNAVKELALSLKVGSFFNDDKVTHGYSRKGLWKHSLGVAMCAKNIYRKEFSEKGDTVYSAGLIHDIGIIVEEQYELKAFHTILQMSEKEEISLREAEKVTQGFDHCMIARNLTRAWNLPEDIIAAIAYHHQPTRVDPIYAKQSNTLFISDYICQKFGVGHMSEKKLDDELFLKCTGALEIDPIAVEIIAEDVIEELNKMEERGEI